MRDDAVSPLPLDVRLMNLSAMVLAAIALLLIVAAVARWSLRHPLFTVVGVTVHGDVSHNSVPTLRANVGPRLRGDFVTLDLRDVKSAFEAVPWVRRAVVRRQFPNRLRVELQEHQVAAMWGPESESRMLNVQGEVFEANVGDVDQDDLPRLHGPDASSAEVLAMYRAVAPLFEPLDLSVEELTLSSRGSWSLRLDTGATVEMGRGEVAEVAGRTERFVQSLTAVAGQYGRRADALLAADLRHSAGYALKLRGVSTEAEKPKKK